MRSSKLLAKWRSGQPGLIVHLGNFLPNYLALAANAGFDGIWLDLEHQPMSQREVQTLIAFGHLYDIDIMVRPSTREKAALYRYLEDGAAGLMIPHVSTPEEARDLVRKVKFPPLGDRGIAGFGLETNFTLDMTEGANQLTGHAARETFLLVQIETPEAVANADAIAAVPGVDALFIGPADLSIRTQHQPEATRLTLAQAWDTVQAASAKHGKPWGSHAVDLETIAGQLRQGAQVLMYGADFLIMKEGLTRYGHDLRATIAAVAGEST